LARGNFAAPSSLSTERLVDNHRSHNLARFGGINRHLDIKRESIIGGFRDRACQWSSAGTDVGSPPISVSELPLAVVYLKIAAKAKADVLSIHRTARRR
jgi:hypothetical protein